MRASSFGMGDAGCCVSARASPAGVHGGRRCALLLGPVLWLLATVLTAVAQREALQVIAQTGGKTTAGNTITALGWGPSINDAGRIAYKVRIADGREGIFVSGESAPRSALIDSFHSYLTTFSGLAANFYADDVVQINNQGRIAWRVSSRDGLFSFIFRLGKTAGDYRVVAKTRYTRIDTAILDQPSPFCGPLLTPTTGLTPWVTLNNAGRTVFSGIRADTDTHYVLGTPHDANQIWSDTAADFYLSPELLGVANFFPQVADTGAIVVRGGLSATAPIMLFTDPTLDVPTATRIAEATGFNAMGERPGVSDDGRIVAFMGDSKTEGVGIFFAVMQSDGGRLSGPFKATDSGGFSAFIEKARVGVNRVRADASNRYAIVYLAYGDPQGGTPPGPLGLYRTTIDVSDPANPSNSLPALVTRAGDIISGLADPVQSLALYDPINNNGQLAFWVQTATGQAIIGAPVPNREVQGIEITQCIQDWKNEVPLLDGKSTYVVAHIWSADSRDSTTPFDLQVTFSGDGGTPQTLTRKVTATYTPDLTRPPPNYDRTKTNHVVRVPVPDKWCHGNLKITLAADHLTPRLGFAGSVTADGYPEVAVTFVTDVPSLRVRFVRYSWTDGTSTYVPDTGSLSRAWCAMTRMLPAPTVTPTIDLTTSWWMLEDVRAATDSVRLPWEDPVIGAPTTQGDRELINRYTAKLRKLEGCGNDRLTLYVGLLGGYELSWLVGNSLGEALDLPWWYPRPVCCSYVPSKVEPYKDRPDAWYNVVHECGHCLGQWHTIFTGQESWPLNYLFPYRNGKAYISKDGDQTSNTAFFGFDVDRIRGVSCDAADIMSYASGPKVWPSAYTYVHEMDELRARSRAAGRSLSRVAEPAKNRGLLVSGWVSTNPVSGGILSVEEAGAYDGSLPSAGDWELVFNDSHGTLIASYPFVPDSTGSTNVVGFFALLVPFQPGTTSMTLMCGTNDLHVLTRSPHAPVVTLLQPQGAAWAGDPVKVEWSSSDADGDPLTFDVLFSADGGSEWAVLGLGITNQYLDVPAKALPGSTQAVFRVLVSDGFNTSSAESAGFGSLTARPPVVMIFSPPETMRYDGPVDIALAATAIDPQEGELAADSLAWTSSRDGPLGVGSRVYVNAGDLSAGDHVITVDAVNRAGLHATRSVTIRVVRDANMNGLPDWWEQLHFGSVTAANPEDDADDDGMDNEQEYTADTDPTNNRSRLEITEIARTPNGLRIRWQGGTGASQYVECRDGWSTLAGAWTCLFSNRPPTPMNGQYNDGTTMRSRYYRIRAMR